MSKYNRLTQTVFSDIVKTENRVSLYDRFLSTDEDLGIPIDASLAECKRHYTKIVTAIKTDTETLSRLEEAIVQMRCKLLINENIKISIGRGYIYVRTLFVRADRDVKDIRVLVDVTEKWGDDPDKLANDPIFMALATKKLIAAMDKHINDNLHYIRKISQ